MVSKNEVLSEDIAAVFFTTTSDISDEFPAVAAREMGWDTVPLICGHEMAVPHGLENRMVIAVDPMLATGNSSAAAIELLKKSGAKNIRFLCLLAAPEGIKRMEEAHPDVPIVTAAVDSHLNSNGYIVPGLGDAGDRMYGTK